MPELVLYNSLSRSKETFKPRLKGRVSMYVCGITAYDYCHLGHARMLVSFDLIYRYLCSRGFEVTYVRNITDIDDKIIERARSLGVDFRTLTERFVAAMNEDMEALNLKTPTVEPRATDSIPAMTELIEKLLHSGHAYRSEDSGDVLYSVRSFDGYGKLSGKSIDDLRSGARVPEGKGKRDPLDFALWKSAREGEPSWPSPFGAGRPGWHIECSAMAWKELGEEIDLHAGGMDLQFPHHENEIAQSEAAHGCRLARYWMHNGFVRIDDEKMSKSLGNFATIRDLLQQWRGEEVRLMILMSHYRQPLDFSAAKLQQARRSLQRLYGALQAAGEQPAPEAGKTAPAAWRERWHGAMSDDFNSPRALAVLFELAAEIQRLCDQGRAAAHLAAELRQLGTELGILEEEPAVVLSGGDALDRELIERLMAERDRARQQKDFAAADELRERIRKCGAEPLDRADGSHWRRL